jgi:hypothetical protein
MHTRSLLLFAATGLALPSGAQTPQFAVVPAAYATLDAVSYLWIAGASSDERQQTLVGSSHLTAMLGRSLTAIEYRRTAANEVYQGGTANMTVTLSTSPSRPLHASQFFAANVGVDATAVFAGLVTLPTSPIELGPTVPWTTANTVRIVFQTPFVYHGGTLCIDVLGLAVPGQHADWWMADAVFEDLSGTSVEVGNGCGTYGGPSHRWSLTHDRNLVPGNLAYFEARGPHWSFGVAAFGLRAPMPVPLTALGLPSPGCDLHLATIDALMPALFVPHVHPLLQAGPAVAWIEFWIPDDAAVFGTTMTTQWFECSQSATSNAIEWTIAGTIPSLDITSIEGRPIFSEGNVAVCHAHVLRFEYQ